MQELYISNNQNMNSSEPEYYAGDGLLPHEPLQQHVLRSGEILQENCVQNITKLNISHLTNCFLYRSSLGAGYAIQSLLLGLVRGRHVILQASRYSLKKSYLIFQLLLTFHN